MARSCSSSTSCTRWSVRARQRAPSTPATCSSRPWRAATAGHRRNHAERVPQVHRKGQGAGAALPDRLRRRAQRRGHHRHSARPQGALRGTPQRAHQGCGHRGRGRALAPLHQRPLPADKAIDLVDEAAASLAIQIGSVPTEIDQLEREATSLEIERAALKRETDPKAWSAGMPSSASWPREGKITALRSRWTKERDAISRVSELKSGSKRCASRPRSRRARACSTAPPRFSMASYPNWKPS